MINIKLLQSKRTRRLFKESFWIVLGQTMVVVGSLVGVRLITELLNPSEYGELALGMTVAVLVNQVVFGPLSNGAIRFYAPAQEKGDLRGYLNAVHWLALSVIGFIVFLLLFTVVGLLISEQTEWIAITTVAFVFAVFSGYNSILNGIQNAARQRSIVALHQGMASWARFLIAAGLLMWLGASSTLVMIGYLMAIILVIGSQYVFFRKIIPEKVLEVNNGKKWREQIWKYSWPFASWGIFTWAQLASDRWALGIFATTQSVGLYSVLFQLGYYPMSLGTGMAVQLMAPIFYQRVGDASDKGRNARVNALSWHLIWLALGVTCSAFMVALLLHTKIFQIFVAKEYMPVSHLLPWMLLSGGVFASGQIISLYITSQMKTQEMVVGKIATASLGVILNFIGAYLFDITGVVVSSVIFSIMFFFWMIAISKKINTVSGAGLRGKKYAR